jgi:hypothetical protein
MVGAPAAAWTVAAGLAGGYLLLLAAVHVSLGGIRRPAAFAGVAGLAIATSATLLAIGRARNHDQPLRGGRIATRDIGPSGAGTQQEALGFIGPGDRSFGLKSVHQSAELRPLDSGGAAPTIAMLPFSAPSAGISPARLEHVWFANRAINVDHGIEAVARFESNGLALTVDNGLPSSIDSPQLIWGERIPLPSFAQHRSTIHVGSGESIETSTVLTETAKLRAQIENALLTSLHPPAMEAPPLAPPVLIGWIDPACASATFDASEPAQMQSQVLVRTLVRLERSASGSEVRIDGVFSQIATSHGSGLPYDFVHRQWLVSSGNGAWLIGFVPPPEAGKLQPIDVTLRADLAAPRQVVTILRGQCASHQAKEDANGAVVATWQHPIEAHTVSFECQPADYDSDGRVWLLFKVDDGAGDDASGAARGSANAWRVRRLELSVHARVLEGSSSQVEPQQ